MREITYNQGKSTQNRRLPNPSPKWISYLRVLPEEPFRIGSKLSQSGKHKKPRRESRLFSFKSRVFWGFLLTAAPSCSSLPARSTSRIPHFLAPTPSRKAKSLRLSRLTGPNGLTELGRQRVLPAAENGEFESCSFWVGIRGCCWKLRRTSACPFPS